MSRSRVVIDLAADARFARDLAAGGVFVAGCALRLSEECDLVVCGRHHRLMLPARVVYVDEQRGAGLELVGFSIEIKAQLAELEPVVPLSLDRLDDPALDAGGAAGEPAQEEDGALPGFIEPAPLVIIETLDDDLELRGPHDTDAYPQVGDAHVEAAAHRAGGGDFGSDADPETPGSGDPDAETTPDDPAGAGRLRATATPSQPVGRNLPHLPNLHERLRGLTLAAQIKLAVSGELHERIVLERLYGKNVWETLLHNPRLTPPEVSRIARYGSLPRVLLEIIVGNNAWLQVPEVRRALLSNPRLGTDQVMKVLRLTPKHELKLAAIQTAYPATVRQVARMMLRGD